MRVGIIEAALRMPREVFREFSVERKGYGSLHGFDGKTTGVCGRIAALGKRTASENR
jgi:hypothetical protein